MVTVIFALATAACAIGCLCKHISTLALACWIAKKGYTPPTDEEVKECTAYVTKKLLRIK